MFKTHHFLDKLQKCLRYGQGLLPSEKKRRALDFNPLSSCKHTDNMRTQLLVARLSWINDVRGDHDVSIAKLVS